VAKVEVTPPTAGSDHASVLIASVDLGPEHLDGPGVIRRWRYNRVDVGNLDNAIRNENWEIILTGVGLHLATNLFTDKLVSIFKAKIHFSEKSIKSKDRPWFSADTKSAINKRDKLHKKYVRINNPENKRIYQLNL
jgi:hypothetical protein